VGAADKFDVPIPIFLALIERFHENSLVRSVRQDVVDVAGQAGMAIGRDAGVAQICSIGRPRSWSQHDGDCGHNSCDNYRSITMISSCSADGALRRLIELRVR